MDVADVQAMAATVDEEGAGSSACRATLAAGAILREYLLGRGMDRHEAGFAELGTAKRQQAFLEIDIVKLQANRLAYPHAGDTEQPEQAVIGPTTQAVGRLQCQSATEQLLDLLLRIEERSCPARTKRQQPRRRNLGSRVDRNLVAREAADKAKPLRARRGQNGWVLLCPLQRELRRNECRATGLKEISELQQPPAGVPEFESQVAPQVQVVLNGLS
jgi:hypothetical protein